MDKRFTTEGTGENPHLSWSGAPSSTKGYALIMDDLSTQSANTTALVHWNLFIDNPDITEIATDVSGTTNLASDFTEGTNYEGNQQYAGPNPPSGEKHEYQFCIYAVDKIPDDIDINTSLNNQQFSTKYASIITAKACFKAYYGTGTSTSTSSNSTGFKTTTPMRYLVENYRNLTDDKIKNYFIKFNKEDLSTISIFEAWGSYLHYRVCQVDQSLTFTGLTQGLQNCTQTAAGWLNTAYITTNGVITNDTFSYAYSQASDILIAMKCDSGEIDAATCQTYYSINSQNNNTINSINDSRIRSYAEVTQQLYQCSYEGQIMSDGSVCIR